MRMFKILLSNKIARNLHITDSPLIHRKGLKLDCYEVVMTKHAAKSKKKLKRLLIIKDWCKGCGICVNFCPKGVLELSGEDKAEAVRPQDCICCILCELRCPDLAIEVQMEQEKNHE